MNQKAAQIEYWYIVGFNAAILILSFTSMPVVFTTSRDWFASMQLPPYVVFIGANAVTLLYYGSVELLISILLPYSAEEVTSARMKGYNKKKRRYVRTVLAVGFMLTGISMSMSYFFSQDAAAKISKHIDITPFQEIQATQSGDYAATLSSLDDELKEARRTEKQRIAAAIANGPEKWQELYKSRNGWFLKQKGKVGEYIAAIDAEKNKVRQLEEEKRQFALSGSAKKDEILASVAGVQLAQAKDAEADRGRKQLALFIIACGAGLVAVVLAFMLGFHRAAEGRQVEDAPMSPALIISRFLGMVWRGVSDTVTERYELSFSGATMDATSQATRDTSHARKNQGGAGGQAGGKKNNKAEALSDTGSRQNVRYIDLKNDIDRIRRGLRYNWGQYKETRDDKYADKMRYIMNDKNRGVAWLQGMGFECSFDEEEGRFSVEEPK